MSFVRSEDIDCYLCGALVTEIHCDICGEWMVNIIGSPQTPAPDLCPDCVAARIIEENVIEEATK